VPLNPRLYQLLDYNVPGGVVRIANEGQVRKEFTFFDLRTGENRAIRQYSGEEYQVICPYCSDTSGHLYISHQYGKWNEETGVTNLHLANCFRDNCLEDAANRHHLSIMIFGGLAHDHRTRGRGLPTAPVVAEEEGPIQPAELPRPFTPLTKLPRSHGAWYYLYARGFDIVELVERWGVGYCTIHSPERLAAGRIVIPITMGGVCVGWQARFIGDPPKRVAKYYFNSGCPKRRLLYNLDLASQQDCVVVVEGLTDVFAVGPCGVALFGKKASPQQEDLLVRFWGAKPILILLDSNDPTAQAEAVKLEQRLRPRVRGGLLRVQLPPGLDPGGCPRDALWEFLRAEAAAHDIEIKATNMTEGGSAGPTGLADGARPPG
jgi:hypothetical protein